MNEPDRKAGDQPDIADDYPFSVARPYALLLDEGRSFESRLWAVHFCLYQALKMAALPMVSQYLSPEGSLEEMDRKSVGKINKAIARIRCPFLSDWIALVHTLAKHVNEEKLGISPLFPLRRSLSGLACKVRPFSQDYSLRGRESLTPFEAILTLRNNLVHGAIFPDEHRCAELVDYYRLILADILLRFDFLADCRLRAILERPVAAGMEAVFVDLKGANPPDPETGVLEPEWEDAFEDIRSDLAIQYGDGPSVPLYPLFMRGNVDPMAQYDGHYAIRTMKAGKGDAVEMVRLAHVYYLGISEKFCLKIFPRPFFLDPLCIRRLGGENDAIVFVCRFDFFLENGRPEAAEKHRDHETTAHSPRRPREAERRR